MDLFGWIKKTGENIINIYKEDLQEFSNNLKKDTEEVVKKGSTSINNFLQNTNENEKPSNETINR